MKKTILAAMALSFCALTANATEVVQVPGTGGRSFASDTEVKTLKEACALANEVAESQAFASCALLDGKAVGVTHKTVSPVVNLGGRSGSCRITVDVSCEVSF